jgi:hypothetical protein
MNSGSVDTIRCRWDTFRRFSWELYKNKLQNGVLEPLKEADLIE